MKLLNQLKSLPLFVTLISTSLLYPSLYGDEENFYQRYQDSAMSSAAGTPWNAKRQLELVQKADGLLKQELQGLDKISYPISINDLEVLYQKTGHDVVPFFTYSSMIDKESGAVKAIAPESAATQTRAVAFGIQRTFNREMAAATVEGGWGPLKRPNDLAILNIFEQKDAVLNGVVFQLPIADLLTLSKREVGYDLVPVVVTLWDDALDQKKDPEMFVAYTFQAPDYQNQGTRYTNTEINPIPGYFNFLQQGLKLAGEDFTAMWWATTYLADQKTLVKELPYQIIDLQNVSGD